MMTITILPDDCDDHVDHPFSFLVLCDLPVLEWNMCPFFCWLAMVKVRVSQK